MASAFDIAFQKMPDTESPISALASGYATGQKLRKNELDIEHERAQTGLEQAQTKREESDTAFKGLQSRELQQKTQAEQLKAIHDKWYGPALAFSTMYDDYLEEAKKQKNVDPDTYAQKKIQPKWDRFVQMKGPEAQQDGIQMSPQYDNQQMMSFLSALDIYRIRSARANVEKAGKVSGNLRINDVSQEDAGVIEKAIADGRLDPNHVNSRTAPIYAKVLKSNSNIDFVNASSTAAAVKKVEGQRSMVESFEKTASKNFDMIEGMYDKMGRDKSVYVLNKLRAKWDYDFSGDPQLVPLARSMKTALTEYAKVITGQTGGAAVSDSARKEVETLLSVADRPETFKNSLKAHRQEMKNRMDSFQETISNLRQGGRGGNVRSSSDSAAPSQQRAQGKDGKWYINDGNGWRPE